MGGFFSKGKKKFVSKRKGNTPIPPGKHYYFTILFGLFFIAGAFAGYGKEKSKVCLFGSGSCGLVTLFLGIAHLIDHRRANVEIEKAYLALPLVMSFVVAVLMSCFWGIGAAFMPSGFVAICCWIGTVYYIYAVASDWGTRVLDHDHLLQGSRLARWTKLSTTRSPNGNSEERKSFL
jgi:uncharacterized membrane protein (UPF0136 family)